MSGERPTKIAPGTDPAETAENAAEFWWSYLSEHARAALTRHDKAGLASTVKQALALESQATNGVLAGLRCALTQVSAHPELGVMEVLERLISELDPQGLTPTAHIDAPSIEYPPKANNLDATPQLDPDDIPF